MDAITTWVKASVADWHSSAYFHMFGHAVDKQDAMLAIVILVVGVVALFWTTALVNDLRKGK